MIGLSKESQKVSHRYHLFTHDGVICPQTQAETVDRNRELVDALVGDIQPEGRCYLHLLATSAKHVFCSQQKSFQQHLQPMAAEIYVGSILQQLAAKIFVRGTLQQLAARNLALQRFAALHSKSPRSYTGYVSCHCCHCCSAVQRSLAPTK